MKALLVLSTAALLTGCAGYPLIVTPDFSALTPVKPTEPPPIAPATESRDFVTTPEAAATPRATSRPQGEDSEEAYYRGVYDICVWVGAQSRRVLDCITFTKYARDAGWYGQESPGWRWRDVAPELLSY